MLNQSIALATRNLRGLVFSLVLALLAMNFSVLPAKAASNPAAININNSICDLNTAGYLGAGSVNNPWQISDSASLWETTDCEAQSPGGNYVLTRDINLSGASTFSRRAIGYVSVANINRFQGTFDGQGHSISNLNIEGMYSSLFPAQTVASAGLFAWLNNAVVRNVALSGVISGATGDFSADDDEYSTGAVAGRSTGNLVLANLTTSATVSGMTKVGGLVGVVDLVSASNLVVMGRVDGRGFVGGFIGWVSQSATISNGVNEARIYSQFNNLAASTGGILGFAEQASLHYIENRGAVHGIIETGGLVGTGGSVTISSSVNSGEVVGGASQGLVPGSQAAGLVGYAQEVRIFQSANRGAVSLWGNTGGGLVAQAIKVSIEQSENSGLITLRDGNVGGLIGRSIVLDIKDSLNTGRVVANTTLAGLVARVSSTSRIDNSYNFGALSQSPEWSISRWLTPAPTTIDGVMAFGSGTISSSYTIPPSDKVGTSTVLQLRVKDTYVGWDFVSIWGFNCAESIATPKLRALSGNTSLSSSSCPISIPNPSPGPTPPAPPSPVLNETPPGATSSSSSTSPSSSGTGSGSGSSTPSFLLYGNYTSSPGLVLHLKGSSLDRVDKVFIGTYSATISASAASTLSIVVPKSIPLGTYDLILESSSDRFVKVQALRVQASPITGSVLTGKTFALSKFSGGRTSLNPTHRQFVARLLLGTDVKRVVCTALIVPNMTHHARVQVRLRAKAACEQVKFLLPKSSVWVQSRISGHKKMLGRVMLTIRG